MKKDRDCLDPDQTYVWATNWDAMRANLKHVNSQRHGNRNPVAATLVANLDQSKRLTQSIQFDCQAMVLANTDHTCEFGNFDSPVSAIEEKTFDRIAIQSLSAMVMLAESSVDACFAGNGVNELVLECEPRSNDSNVPALNDDIDSTDNYDLELGLLEAVQDLSRFVHRAKARRVREIILEG